MQKTTFSVALGRQLRTVRMIHGLSAGQLSELVGITEDNVYKYERGERAMTIEFKYRCADALQCSPQEFEYGLDRRNNESLPGLRRPMHVTSPETHDNLCWLGSEWDGDVDALITFAAMVARWPVEKRRELYMQAVIQNDIMISSGELDAADQPAGMDAMKQSLGHLYAGEGKA